MSFTRLFAPRPVRLAPVSPGFTRPSGISRGANRMMTTGRFVPAWHRLACRLAVCILPVGLLAVCLLTVCLLAALAENALAATSEACLRRCLTTCPEKGRAGDDACLRSCLKDCPVHCGTVDTDCAVDCLKRTPALPAAETSEAAGEPWEGTSKRSSAALRVSGCAEACTVKPDCRPMSYDTGPAELSGAAKAPHARQSAPEREKRLEPKDRSFSLVAPQGWTLHEQDRDHELLFLAKGAALLDYTQISVRHVPGPHRTAARFRFDLEHPYSPAANATATVMTPIMARSDLSGAEAWRSESRSQRTLLGQEGSVPILKRTLLLPQESGYFVLSLETPEAATEANTKIFEHLAGSFRPQVKAKPREPELSAQERAVWAGFFGSDGKVVLAGSKHKGPDNNSDKGAPLEIDPGFGQPQQYLTDTARTRLVAGRTLAAPALDTGVLTDLLRGCGGPGPTQPGHDAPDTSLAAQAQALSKAWDALRGQQVLVTDEIFLPGSGEYGLKVQEAPKPDRGGAALHELKADPARQGRLSRPEGRTGMAMHGSLALLSRVAFSADGRLALAYVAHRQTSPGTSHFVLLRRTGESAGNGWTLCGAAQKDMLIY